MPKQSSARKIHAHPQYYHMCGMPQSRKTIRNALDEGENSRTWVPGQSILERPAQQLFALKIIALYFWQKGNNTQFIAYNLTQMTWENILNRWFIWVSQGVRKPSREHSELAFADLTNPDWLHVKAFPCTVLHSSTYGDSVKDSPDSWGHRLHQILSLQSSHWLHRNEAALSQGKWSVTL